MGRLCERPGCSENAALTYGMRPEDLVFWIDVLREGSGIEVGVLCLRHGDSMTVPRGWTLDDLRDPDLHLFRPPPRPDGPASRRNRARRRPDGDDTGQMELGGLIEQVDDVDELDDADEMGVVDELDRADDEAAITEPAVEIPEATATVATPEMNEPANVEPPEPAVALNWKPAFDDGDDLDGLLAARGPLLSRAFRGERS